MRVHLGSDHAGFELKEAIVRRLTELGHEPVDHGPSEYVATDDYPPFVLRAAEGTAQDPGSVGVVLGGSGNGEAIAANKVKGIRCALAWSTETAQLARSRGTLGRSGSTEPSVLHPARPVAAAVRPSPRPSSPRRESGSGVRRWLPELS